MTFMPLDKLAIRAMQTNVDDMVHCLLADQNWRTYVWLPKGAKVGHTVVIDGRKWEVKEVFKD